MNKALIMPDDGSFKISNKKANRSYLKNQVVLFFFYLYC